LRRGGRCAQGRAPSASTKCRDQEFPPDKKGAHVGEGWRPEVRTPRERGEAKRRGGGTGVMPFQSHARTSSPGGPPVGTPLRSAYRRNARASVTQPRRNRHASSTASPVATEGTA